MKHLALLEMRNKKVITTPEYMVIFNFYFRNFNQFLESSKIPKSHLRELFKSGMQKIVKFKRHNH